MALHLLKLCVGPSTIEELETRIALNDEAALARGQSPAPFHVTRMMPKRSAEIAGKGSIYWVMKGALACRQRIVAIEPVIDEAGIGRCRLMFGAEVVPVSPRPCRPFQGWRYLAGRDAPADLDQTPGSELAQMPESLRRELAALGLL